MQSVHKRIDNLIVSERYRKFRMYRRIAAVIVCSVTKGTRDGNAGEAREES